jgi:2-dehydro-3-deoxygalactonokinase
MARQPSIDRNKASICKGLRRLQNLHDRRLFSLLSRQSVLRHSLDGAGSNGIEFARSIQLMMTEPASFAGQLFSIRAGNLSLRAGGGTANARRSGLLIGAELAAAQSYWLDQSPVIVGNGAQSDLYLEGLRTLGRSPRVIDAAGVTLAGLKSAYAQIARSFG